MPGEPGTRGGAHIPAGERLSRKTQEGQLIQVSTRNLPLLTVQVNDIFGLAPKDVVTGDLGSLNSPPCRASSCSRTARMPRNGALTPLIRGSPPSLSPFPTSQEK